MRTSRQNPMRQRGSGKRRGFILMEVIVAMTLLALIMTPLAAMVFKITARSHSSVGNTYRNAVVMQEVNLLESLPYDSLPTGTTTSTVTTMPYPYTKTVISRTVLSEVAAERKVGRARSSLRPTRSTSPDTIKFIRSSANTNKALIDDLQ